MAAVTGTGGRIDIFLHLRYNIEVRHILDRRAAMVELADTKDLKSFGSDSVPVRPRLAAPGRSSFAPALFLFIGFERYRKTGWIFQSDCKGIRIKKTEKLQKRLYIVSNSFILMCCMFGYLYPDMPK